MTKKLTEVKFGKDQYHNVNAMKDWCSENIGLGKQYWDPTFLLEKSEKNVLWTVDSMFGNTTFSFKNEKDAIMFTLKWS